MIWPIKSMLDEMASMRLFRAMYEAVCEGGSNMGSLIKRVEDIGLLWEAFQLEPLALGDEAVPQPNRSSGEGLLGDLQGGDPLVDAPAPVSRQVPQYRWRVHE